MVLMVMACTSVAVVLQVDYSRRLNKSDIFGASDLESDDDGRNFTNGALLLLFSIMWHMYY